MWGGNLCGVYAWRIFLCINWWKNFENQSTFAKVIIKHQGVYFFECIKSLAGQKLTMPAHPTKKACWIGGELWNRKPVFKKGPGLHALSRSVCHSEACPVRNHYSAPVVPRQIEISGSATACKWSPVRCRSSAGQGKFAGQRPTFYHCATQPTGAW